MTFELTITNQGNVAAQSIQLWDYLPDALTLPDASRAGADAPAVEWYGHGVPLTALALAQLALLATFMIAGAYRTMCIELQVRTTPWLWLAFIAWLATLLAWKESCRHSEAKYGLVPD